MAIETDIQSNEKNSSSKLFFRKRRGCPISASGADIDYKNPDMLKKFISEGGRMLPSRITNVSAKNQRKLKKAIRLSRQIALLPFVFKIK